MEQKILDTLGDLDEAANLLKASLVAKDELVELLITCAVAQEHLLIVGPPGTGKSEIVKRFALLCTPDSTCPNGQFCANIGSIGLCVPEGAEIGY